MRIRALITIAAAFLSSWAQADTLKSENELRSLADAVMGKVAKNDLQAAFSAMRPFVVISDSEFQSAVSNSKAQREQFGARYGKAIGSEFIGQVKIGDSLVKITYIEKTEKHALPWLFYFYKSPNGWVLNSFQWNDQMPSLFSGK